MRTRALGIVLIIAVLTSGCYTKKTYNLLLNQLNK